MTFKAGDAVFIARRPTAAIVSRIRPATSDLDPDVAEIQLAGGEDEVDLADLIPAEPAVWVVRAVADLKAINLDWQEVAGHLWQDAVYLRVLRWVAEGRADAAFLAAQATQIDDIKFSRYYE